MWDALAAELLHEIAIYVNHRDERDWQYKLNCNQLASSVQVCKHWKQQLTPAFYREPNFRWTTQFLFFTETILSQVPDNSLGTHVHMLNLDRVSGTTDTLRLAQVVNACPNLRGFTAPRSALPASLINLLPSMHRLQAIDLQHIIERFEISHVINNCSTLSNLVFFKFPRCAVATAHPIKAFPPNLISLTVQGGVRDEFVMDMPGAQHVRILQISHIPRLTVGPLLSMIGRFEALLRLVVVYPIPHLGPDALDRILDVAVNLTRLMISIDYISPRFFQQRHDKLAMLELHYSGIGKRDMITVQDLDVLRYDVARSEGIEEELELPFPRLQCLGIGDELFRTSNFQCEILRSRSKRYHISFFEGPW